MRSYYLATALIAPLMPLWLAYRRLQGKEDPARIKERLGITLVPRPPGMLLWLHAASVGEANSVLLVIHQLRERWPQVSLLLTTGTVTSARLMQARLPEGVIHQYAPVDTPQATLKFVRHWKPDIAFFVESELWPNLILTADYYQCFMGLINGRMSARSFTKWQRHPAAIKRLLGCFDIIFAQSDADADRLEALGAKEVRCIGNLKYDAAMLPCDEAELVRLKNAIGARPVWLAASTHPGEEKKIAEAHAILTGKYPNILTVIVPRHPERGIAIAGEFKKHFRIALRSKKEPITEQTQFYIADTLGELGLFYRLCEIVFMGGSLVKRGGQNPLEAARLACAVIAGPYTHNFSGIYGEMGKIGIVRRVGNAYGIAIQVTSLMADAEALDGMQMAAKQWTLQQSGAAGRLLDIISPIFEQKS